MIDKVREYIESHWDECIKENREDVDTLIGLPYPYTVPAVGCFDAIYYWDTYFTNKGLEVSNRHMTAKNNTDDMLYLVNRFGFMPNGNRYYFLDGSQPPFLSEMVHDVYKHYKDKAWLVGAYDTLLKEYEFWMTKRITPIGLNRYGGEMTDEKKTEYADYLVSRIGFSPDGMDKDDIGRHSRLMGESGWDMNPRWGFCGYDYAHIELNSLLYLFESNMCYFAKELKNGDELLWLERMNNRKSLMQKYMKNKDGLLNDYNFAKKRPCDILSAAVFFPLYAKVADEKEAKAAVDALPLLEAEYGLLTCEKNDAKGVYQWDYPNGWACLQYIAVIGLDNYGYKEEAMRISEKTVELIRKVFAETGNLWEKYNVVEGNINVNNEYDMPPMMGWTAGVYLALTEYIENDKTARNS